MRVTLDDGPGFGDRPVLWRRGGADRLVLADQSRSALATLAGCRTGSRIWPGARHEIVNETHRDAVRSDAAALLRRIAI